MHLKRNRPIGRNAKRSRETYTRNFGERGEAVRAMRCLTLRELGPALVECRGPVQAAHVLARGMGGAKGDRRQLVPLCARHHEEAGEGSWKPQQPSKRAAFEKRHGLDLKAEAERIAIELDGRGVS
jgi:hypothetical protein